jgi:hypothetical protein
MELKKILYIVGIIRACGGIVTEGNIGKSGKGWKRIYILNKQECQIGRVSFLDGEIKSIKNYKKDYRKDLDETDFIIFRMVKFIDSNILISDSVYEELVEKADSILDKEMEEKIQWRRDNPPKIRKSSGKPNRRKALQKGNIRRVLRKLIQEYGV